MAAYNRTRNGKGEQPLFAVGTRGSSLSHRGGLGVPFFCVSRGEETLRHGVVSRGTVCPPYYHRGLRRPRPSGQEC
jgi:hypothetical protein